MTLYVGPVVCFDLGQVGELELLGAFDREVAIPDPVVEDVAVEPAATNLDRLAEKDWVEVGPVDTKWTDRAEAILGASEPHGDVRIVEAVLAESEAGNDVGVVAADRRLRAIAEGLGVTVTGPLGVIVRAAMEDKYLSRDAAKRIARRLDGHGLHMTGELRERAVGGAADG